MTWNALRNGLWVDIGVGAARLRHRGLGVPCWGAGTGRAFKREKETVFQKDNVGFGVEDEGFETTSKARRLVRRLLQWSLETSRRACLSGWDILTLCVYLSWFCINSKAKYSHMYLKDGLMLIACQEVDSLHLGKGMGIYFQRKRKRNGTTIVGFSSHSISWVGLRASRDKLGQKNNGLEVGEKRSESCRRVASCQAQM